MSNTIQLLQSASAEIKSLRNQNQLMRARLDMFDSMMLLFGTRPDYPSQGMGPDIAWEIDKFVESQAVSNNQS